MYKNSEKYSDPTAGEALAHISCEERKNKRQAEWISIVTSGKKLVIHEDQPYRIKQFDHSLRAYGEVDELPVELLNPKVEEKMDSLIGELSQLLNALGAKKDGV